MTIDYDPSSRFASKLHDWILDVQPDVMVETGYSFGVSAHWIVRAMDKTGVGVLYSMESDVTKVPFEHPRLKFIQGLSQVWMDHVYREVGPWDVFLHDSDHGAECQRFEYNKAMHYVRRGGYILSDDYEYGQHNTWGKFLSENSVTDTFNIGSVQGFKKP